MSSYEYKTVALPRSIAKKRRRRQSEADLVAEQLGTVLNDEATDGWEYVRAETLTTPGHKGMMSKSPPAAYVVLVFRRVRSIAWNRAENAQQGATSQSQVPVERRSEPRAMPPVMQAPQAPQQAQAQAQPAPHAQPQARQPDAMQDPHRQPAAASAVAPIPEQHRQPQPYQQPQYQQPQQQQPTQHQAPQHQAQPATVFAGAGPASPSAPDLRIAGTSGQLVSVEGGAHPLGSARD